MMNESLIIGMGWRRLPTLFPTRAPKPHPTNLKIG
jgi:hypothetical protein